MSRLVRPSFFIRKHFQVGQVWDERDLGYLFRLGLIRGRKLLRGCEVDEDDVLRIYAQRVK